MRKLLLAVMIAAPLLAAACNTIEGLGKDVQAAGKAVSDSAEKTK
ncbi:MAG: entericidin A/B family lipoprotein [Hyphomonadaceae bacterium]